MKLKRLVSAVVAVGMMVAMLPVSAVTAFADDTITNISIVDGKVDATGFDYCEGNPNSYYYSYRESEKTNGQPYTYCDWAYRPGDDTLIIYKLSYAGAGEQTITTKVDLRPNGTITDGYYKIAQSTGTITGGTFVNASGNADVAKQGTITGGVFGQVSNNKIDGISHHLSAQDCTINGIISDEATVIGSQEITVTAFSKTFKEWKVEGVDGVDTTPVIDNVNKTVTLHFTIPANAADVTVTAVKKKVPLIIENNLPVYDGEEYDGSLFDGWKYDNTRNTLTVYKTDDNEPISLNGSTIDWAIYNYGILENGTVKSNIRNYGTVRNLTMTGIFHNDKLEDEPEGVVESAVLSAKLDFLYTTPSITWLKVNNATVNGVISDMAAIIGKQTVTVTTTDTNFTGWVVSGDSDLTLTEEQRTSKTLTLELDGSKKNTIVLTAMTPEGYQHFTVIDGKATNADGETITSAQPGHTVTLTANDAPDGMVFDRWEVTPTAAEAELEGFDASSATTTFKMGTQEITIRAMYRMADVEEPNVLGTVAIVATAGVGAAVLGWTGYNIAADLYAQSILPEGTAIPETKEALAVMLWQNAGKPEVVAADGTALSETEQAQQWVVANGLMENEKDGSFHPEKGVGKFAALNAIKAQSEAKVSE